MSETVRQLFLKARALLDEYSDDGVIIPEAEVIDMQGKSILLADMAQKILYKTGKMFGTFEIANKPAPNLLGNLSNFDIVDFVGDTQYYPNESGVVGAKAYYAESDGDNGGTNKMEIEENQSGVWTVIKTETFPASITSLTPYKGLITPLSSTNSIRMKLSGSTHFRHVNRCLFSYPFSVSKIPSYRPWIKAVMPSNFQSRDQVIKETSTGYTNTSSYKWEGWKNLYYSYNFDGNIRIIYKPVPVTLTGIDDVLEVDDITAQAIVYYIGARLAPFENKELVQFFEDEFQSIVARNSATQPAIEEPIEDYYRL
jgi:hypothetical protein